MEYVLNLHHLNCMATRGTWPFSRQHGSWFSARLRITLLTCGFLCLPIHGMAQATETSQIKTIAEEPSAELTKGIRISAGRGPAGLAISADGKWLYVTSNADNTLSIIDLALQKLSRTIKSTYVIDKHDGCPHNFCRGVGAIGVAVDSTGHDAYVSSMSMDTLSFVDLQSGKVEQTVKLQRFPQDVIVSPDGQRIYVFNLVANSVSVVDAGAKKVSGEPIRLSGGNAENLPFGRPYGMALSADGKRLFITNGIASTIDVFDTDTHQQIGKIEPDGGAADLHLDPHTGNPIALFSDGIVEYDAQTFKPVQAMRFCTNTVAYHFTVSPDSNTLALSLAEENRVVTVDRKTGLVNSAYAAEDWPLALRYTPDGKTLVALASGDTSGVLLFDAGTHTGASAFVATHGELFCRPDGN
jgi:DNA-binding beta-propeller fold protein YncE